MSIPNFEHAGLLASKGASTSHRHLSTVHQLHADQIMYLCLRRCRHVSNVTVVALLDEDNINPITDFGHIPAAMEEVLDVMIWA